MSIGAREFDFVRELVRRESAIVLEAGKEYLVESRLLPLARATGQTDVTAYVAEVARARNPRTLTAIVEALTTNETSWFRDNDPFVALRTAVLPALAKTRTRKSLRIWCAACSTGQEPYSVAMTVLDSPLLADFDVTIVATDLSEEVLAKGRAGEYSQLEVNRGLPASLLVRHFTREGLNWRISPQLRSRVEFKQLNLLRPYTLMGKFDIVFMRNVLIYFDQATKQDILRRVRQVTAPDGYLFLGAAEMTRGLDDSWEREPAGRSALYRIREEDRSCVPW
ncbi:CheR family methyltransferase [Nocardioides sp. LHG3406-4]|uniref:CheR family methyltransferase n=1 Tax=Nocardioides sp. LHG3406-4 TaxID=2804575 RepID=UPI003CE6AB32